MRESHAERERDFGSSRDLIRRDESSPERGYLRPSYGRSTSRYHRSLREEDDHRRYERDDEPLDRDRYERRRTDGNLHSSYRDEAPVGANDYQKRSGDDTHMVETGSDVMRMRRRRNGHNDARETEGYKTSYKRDRSDDEDDEPAKRRRHSDGALQGRSRRDSRDSDMDQDSPPRDYGERDRGYVARKNRSSDGYPRQDFRNERYERGTRDNRYESRAGGYERRSGEGYYDRREETDRYTAPYSRRTTEYSASNDRFRGRAESPRQNRYQDGSGDHKMSDRPSHYSDRFASDDRRTDYRRRQDEVSKRGFGEGRRDYESTTPQQGRPAQVGWTGRDGTGRYGSSRNFDNNRFGGSRDTGKSRNSGIGRDNNDGPHNKRDNMSRNDGNKGVRFNKDRNTGGDTLRRWHWDESLLNSVHNDPNPYHDDEIYVFGCVRYKYEPWPDVEETLDVPESYNLVVCTTTAGKQNQNEADKKGEEGGFDPPSDDFAPLCSDKTAENVPAGEQSDKPTQQVEKPVMDEPKPQTAGEQLDGPTDHAETTAINGTEVETAEKQGSVLKEDKHSTVSDINSPTMEGKSLGEERVEKES